MKQLLIYIASAFALTFFINCNNSNQGDNGAGKTALYLANNIDSNSINLIKEYSYIRKGADDFWEKISGDFIVYSCSYKTHRDKAELIIFQPLNFANDFTTTFIFDTALYYQFNFVQRHDTIINILRVDSRGQAHKTDTLISTKQLFPVRDPFTTFSELTSLENKFKFTKTSYNGDIGNFIEFMITPQYKLTYLPDTTKMNSKYKEYWLGEFFKGKIIKKGWSLLNLEQ
jgi:hypothetical protein